MDFRSERHLIRVPGTSRVFNRLKVLVVLMIPLAMSLMSISSINVALPTIETSIGASDTSVQWMLSGYALVFGMLLVPSGRLGDAIGRGTVWITGVSIFSLGSLVCGFASTPELLNIARVAQGFGAGVLNPQTIGMIQQYFRGEGRARAYSVFGLVIAASVAAGPLFTGLIIRALGAQNGWRASFLWNAPLGFLGIALALMWFPFDGERRRRHAKEAGEAVHTKLDLDPVAMALLAAAVLCIMMPFMLKTGPGFLLLPLAAVLLMIWVKWERRYGTRGGQPMVDLKLFRYRSFTHATAVSGTQFLGGTSIFVLVALFLQDGMHVSALQAGMIGLPNAVLSAIASLWCGRQALTRGRNLVIVGLSCILVGVLGSIGMAKLIMEHGVNFWWLTLPLSLIGIGNGCMTGCNQTLSMLEVPPKEGGVAGGVKSTTERVATAIGNAVITAVFFTLVSRGWAVALTWAYVVIAVIIAVAIGLAIYDRVTLGRGAPPTAHTVSA